MTPTETSAPTTTLPPGRALDVAVARAMGWTSLGNDERWAFTGDDGKSYGCGLQPFSTDDATALRWGVPWLNARGYEVTHTHACDGNQTVTVVAYPEHDGPPIAAPVCRGDNALALALSHLVLAVAEAGR